jgi:hypothetical protein
MTRNAYVASVQVSVGFASTDCLRLFDFLDLPVIVKAAVCLKKGSALARFLDTTSHLDVVWSTLASVFILIGMKTVLFVVIDMKTVLAHRKHLTLVRKRSITVQNVYWHTKKSRCGTISAGGTHWYEKGPLQPSKIGCTRGVFHTIFRC